MNRHIFIKFIFVIVLFLTIISCTFVNKKQAEERYTGPVEKINLGVVPSVTAALIYIAQEKGYFTDSRVEVRFVNDPSVVPHFDDLLSNKSDIIVRSEFTVVEDNPNPNDFKILASIGSGEIIYLVGRRDHGIQTAADLKGKVIGLLPNTIETYFLSKFMESMDLNPNDIKIVDTTIDDGDNSLRNGQFDAMVTFQPHVQQLQEQLGQNAVVFPIQEDRRIQLLLIGSNNFIMMHPQGVKQFLKALVMAEDFVKNNPLEAQAIFSKKIGLEKQVLQSAWEKNDFYVSLNQELFYLLEDETRWAIKNNLTTATDVPNYLDFIYFDALKEVKPEAVTIIGK